MSDWDLYALSRPDHYSDSGDYAYAFSSNFTFSLATTDHDDYPENGSFYLQIDGYVYFRWIIINGESPSRSIVDKGILSSSWEALDMYIHEFLYEVISNEDFYVRLSQKNYVIIFQRRITKVENQRLEILKLSLASILS